MAVGNIHVLHVDDDTAIGALSTAILEGDGDIEVTTTNDPASVPARFEMADFDCIVSEYELSRLDGIGLYERLESQGALGECPFILFTGHGSESVAADACNAGVTASLTKGGPEQYERLTARIRTATAARTDGVDCERTRATDGGSIRDSDGPATLFETLPDPTMLVDFGSAEPRIVRINEAFETVFDCDADAVVGTSVEELPVPTAGGADELEGGLVAETSVTRELQCDTTAGERDFLFRAVPVDTARSYGVYTDISERTAYETRLTALHETARRLMGAESTDEVLDIGLQAARDILGHPMNSIHLYDDDEEALVPTVTTDPIEDLLTTVPSFTGGESIAWRVFDTGEAVICDDVREDPDVRNSATPFRSEMILPLGERGILIAASTEVAAFHESDISLGKVLAPTIQSALTQVERKQLLRERERALTRQNERLDEFAAIVSHDLRTPLDLASVHLELAVGDGQLEDHIDKISQAHDRMSDLIDDVLTWAREGETVQETERVLIPALVSECWADLTTDEATLTVSSEKMVAADRARVWQLFDNLLGNAIDYAGQTATVTVGDLEERDGIYVADDGPGVPVEERESVFASGHTLSTDGTGLGLAIVRQIAEAHGWSITLTESANGGARFEIVF